MTEVREFSDQSFRQFLAEEKLMGCRCRKCGQSYLPPNPICKNCFSQEMEWIEMPPTGKLAAFTCITVGPPSMQAEGFSRDNPYCSGVVEMGDGLRVDARIEGFDARAPEQIKVGMPLRVAYLHKQKEGVQTTHLAFRPL